MHLQVVESDIESNNNNRFVLLMGSRGKEKKWWNRSSKDIQKKKIAMKVLCSRKFNCKIFLLSAESIDQAVEWDLFETDLV